MIASETEGTADPVARRLDRIDWDFPGASTPASSVHSLHWFPGNFIPQIPSHLIELLSAPGELVFDPFCGSGTCGFEAFLLGRRSVQSDASTASIEVTRAKLAFVLDEGLSRGLAEFGRRLATKPLFADGVAAGNPAVLELACWFHPDTLAGIFHLSAMIEGVSSLAVRLVLRMLLTDLLYFAASTGRSVTSTGKVRRHHWGWIADNVKPRRRIQHDPVQMFMGRLEKAYEIARSLERQGLPHVSATVTREDVRACSLADESIDLIVTSPPYLGVVDYSFSNRLTYLWYGWDLDSDFAREIGARRRRYQADAAGAYLAGIGQGLDEMSRVLKPGGYLAMVIGGSSKFPDAASEVVSLAAERLSLVWGPRLRAQSRRRVRPRAGWSASEFVVVFKRER